MLVPKRARLPCHEQGQFHSLSPWAMVNLAKSILYGWSSSFWIPEAPGKPPLCQRTVTKEELSGPRLPARHGPCPLDLSPAALHNSLQALSTGTLQESERVLWLLSLTDTILRGCGSLVGCCPVELNTGDFPDDLPRCSSVAQPLTLGELSRGPLASLPVSRSYRESVFKNCMKSPV